MAFTLEPKAAPALASQNNQKAANASQDSRARAIALLTGAAPQIANQSQVSPEEAVKLGQTHTNEAPTTDATESVDSPEVVSEATKPKEEPLSSQFAVLARKEKALRAKQQAQDVAFKVKELAIAEREAALKAKDSEYQTKYVPKEKLSKEQIWSTLTEMGMSYDDLTQMALNPPAKADPATLSAIEALKAEIKALKDVQDTSKKTYEEQQSNQYKQAVAQIHTEASNLVKSDPNFETIEATNSIGDVVELIERTYKETNKLLTVEEACNAVEEYLVTEGLKIANLKKIQSKLKPEAVATASQTVPAKTGMKTLTNASSTQKPLSNRERAIAAFKGTLK